MKTKTKAIKPHLPLYQVNTWGKALFTTQPHGEQTLREYQTPDPDMPVGNRLFILHDSQARELVLTGEELNSLAWQWLAVDELYHVKHLALLAANVDKQNIKARRQLAATARVVQNQLKYWKAL